MTQSRAAGRGWGWGGGGDGVRMAGWVEGVVLGGKVNSIRLEDRGGERSGANGDVFRSSLEETGWGAAEHRGSPSAGLVTAGRTLTPHMP